VGTSLLTTKLNIPPARPQFIARPHLVERLQEGLGYNLILVSAPVGFVFDSIGELLKEAKK
jgi:ATP/maltotriose-dependent transcriptional regulator MalT